MGARFCSLLVPATLQEIHSPSTVYYNSTMDLRYKCTGRPEPSITYAWDGLNDLLNQAEIKSPAGKQEKLVEINVTIGWDERANLEERKTGNKKTLQINCTNDVGTAQTLSTTLNITCKY